MASHVSAITIVGGVLLAACWSDASRAEPAGAKMLVYGNYCGVGNNAPLAPVDVLDAACARHDDCTPDDDLPTRACNLRLEQEAQAVSDDPRQPGELRLMAGLVAAFASTTASKPVAIAAPASVRAVPPPTTFTTLR